MRIFRHIYEKHGELLLARSRVAHKQIKVPAHTSGAHMVTVGLYQMRNSCAGQRGKDDNLERMLSAIKQMAKRKVRIMAFPEMCLPGYFTPVSGTSKEASVANRQLADDIGTSLYIAKLQHAARQSKMVLAFGFSEKSGRRCFNAIGVIDADGTWLGTRRKNPLCPWRYETESFAETAPSQRSAVFQTRYATVGISDCFDGEFPETIRQMRLDGAQILLWCNAACGDSKLGTSNRINHSGSHAQANKMWVVCCNCVATNASGTSCITAISGEPLVVLPPNEEALGMCSINLALNDDWEPWQSRVCRDVLRQSHTDNNVRRTSACTLLARSRANKVQACRSAVLSKIK